MSSQPNVLVSQPNWTQTWNTLFGDKLSKSPVAALYASGVAELQVLKSTLAGLIDAATADYHAVLAGNPSFLVSPQTVTNWEPLVSAVAVLNGTTAKQNAVNEYDAALSSWYAQNQGKIDPSPMPQPPSI